MLPDVMNNAITVKIVKSGKKINRSQSVLLKTSEDSPHIFFLISRTTRKRIIFAKTVIKLPPTKCDSLISATL